MLVVADAQESEAMMTGSVGIEKRHEDPSYVN